MRTLGFFPEIYKDELLYSVIARYHRHVGNPAISMSNVDLFGRTHIRSTFDLPGYVSDLAERLPQARGLSAERLATEHTHICYYTAFMPAERRSEMCQKQLAGYASLHMQMGVNTYIVPQITSLRFCPECLEEMMATKGELWWKRAHQIPGVLVCHEHGCSLAESGATFWARGQHGFVAATKLICNSDAPLLVADLSIWDMRRLLDVAQRSAALLISSGEMTSYESTTERYRERLFDLGFMKSRSQIDVEPFLDAFRAHHGRTLALTTGLLDESGRFDGWLLSLVRNNRKSAHPLQHVLLQSFLDGRPERAPPFGAGPWRCPNPIAGHGSEMTIRSVLEKKDRCGIIGTFECPCGYSYTMSKLSDGKLRGPRFKSFGPLLDPALIKLVEDGVGLRGAALALGIHPRAIAAASERLGLGKSWKVPPKVGPRIGQAALPDRVPRKPADKPIKLRKKARPRVNWIEVDHRLSQEVAVHAAKLRRAKPPVMVRMRSLEVSMSRPNFISIRREKLPLTMQAIADVTETPDEYHRRRIAIALDDARAQGKASTSSVMRAAGVKPEWRSYIQELIQGFPVSNGT